MIKAKRERLYKDVEFLCNIRPYRNYKNLDSLDEACTYISGEFARHGYKPVEQKWEAEENEYKNIIASYREEKERRTLEHLALEANRFETLGRVVSCMMHDLGSPLTVIESTVEMMLACPDMAGDERRLNTLVAQVRHCNEMVRSTMGFLRSDQNELGRFSLNEIVETCLEVAQPYLRKERVTVVKKLCLDLPMCPGDLTLVRQAVLNLITNACHAMEGQAAPMTISMTTRMTEHGAALSVVDSGSGVAAENRERIFETFFTTKGEKGTGLGLTVVRYVMDKHAGTVVLMPSTNGGAEFVLTFPCAATNGIRTL